MSTWVFTWAKGTGSLHRKGQSALHPEETAVFWGEGATAKNLLSMVRGRGRSWKSRQTVGQRGLILCRMARLINSLCEEEVVSFYHCAPTASLYTAYSTSLCLTSAHCVHMIFSFSSLNVLNISFKEFPSSTEADCKKLTSLDHHPCKIQISSGFY